MTICQKKRIGSPLLGQKPTQVIPTGKRPEIANLRFYTSAREVLCAVLRSPIMIGLTHRALMSDSSQSRGGHMIPRWLIQRGQRVSLEGHLMPHNRTPTTAHLLHVLIIHGFCGFNHVKYAHFVAPFLRPPYPRPPSSTIRVLKVRL